MLWTVPKDEPDHAEGVDVEVANKHKRHPDVDEDWNGCKILNSRKSKCESAIFTVFYYYKIN